MGCYHGDCRRHDRPYGRSDRRDPYSPFGPDYRRKPCCEPRHPYPGPPRRRPDYFDFPRFY